MENEEIKKPEYTPNMPMSQRIILAKEYMIKVAESKAKKEASEKDNGDG